MSGRSGMQQRLARKSSEQVQGGMLTLNQSAVTLGELENSIEITVALTE